MMVMPSIVSEIVHCVPKTGQKIMAPSSVETHTGYASTHQDSYTDLNVQVLAYGRDKPPVRPSLI